MGRWQALAPQIVGGRGGGCHLSPGRRGGGGAGRLQVFLCELHRVLPVKEGGGFLSFARRPPPPSGDMPLPSLHCFLLLMLFISRRSRREACFVLSLKGTWCSRCCLPLPLNRCCCVLAPAVEIDWRCCSGRDYCRQSLQVFSLGGVCVLSLASVLVRQLVFCKKLTRWLLALVLVFYFFLMMLHCLNTKTELCVCSVIHAVRKYCLDDCLICACLYYR